jgi:diacylglycerol kinase (ATP)
MWKGRKVMRKGFKQSFVSAFSGLFYVFRHERNMRIYLPAAGLVFFFSWYFPLERFEIVAVIMAVFVVFIAEMFNTAVEKVVDLLTRHYDPVARIAKDAAAAAVLISSFFALVVGLVVFIPHLAFFLFR